ncbi:hypothetical protein GQE99_10210 [Maritimibacter sp. DP07]|uniref:Uncharacterized protein n=1 Tax=Maritimibacter harenae TaxID=2606218 RepID=A0A845LZC5_9RHOB|nr:hypothetical protein [Maritimibacter harenae]MZR13390.1 hypothetical protein [Maritimibacter harenae]
MAVIATPPKTAVARPIRSADVSDIFEQDHAKYRIKAGRLAGVCIARAFPKPPSKAQGLIAQAEGDTEGEAIAALMTKIAARDVERKSVRRWEERVSLFVPSEEEFVEALFQTPISRGQTAILRAQAIAREDGSTIDQMGRAAGYKSSDTVMKVLCKVGDLLADYLGIDIEEGKGEDGDRAVGIFAVRTVPEADQPSVWIMHPELRNAVYRVMQ